MFRLRVRNTNVTVQQTRRMRLALTTTFRTGQVRLTANNNFSIRQSRSRIQPVAQHQFRLHIRRRAIIAQHTTGRRQHNSRTFRRMALKQSRVTLRRLSTNLTRHNFRTRRLVILLTVRPRRQTVLRVRRHRQPRFSILFTIRRNFDLLTLRNQSGDCKQLV